MEAYSLNEALHPKTFVIDTLELRPFSLGHWMAFETVCSPFLTPTDHFIDQESGILHYFTALLICGQTYEDNKAMLDDPTLFNEKAKAFSDYMLDVINRTPNWNYIQRIRYFKDGYLDYFVNSMPNFSETQTASAPSGLDWKLNVGTLLHNEFGYTESQILNMSLLKLYYEWCAFAEKGGAIHVKNAEQLKAEELAKKQRDAFIENAKKGLVTP